MGSEMCIRDSSSSPPHPGAGLTIPAMCVCVCVMEGRRVVPPELHVKKTFFLFRNGILQNAVFLVIFCKILRDQNIGSGGVVSIRSGHHFATETLKITGASLLLCNAICSGRTDLGDRS